MATHRDPTGAAGGDSGGAESEGGDVTGGGSPGLEPESPGSRTGNGPNYKRASRKGAPRRFTCPYASCDKVYSRAEHLQRHQLNHNPKEIFECDIPDCGQKFVRLDLLARHKKRHSSSYIPRNRVPNFSTGPGNQPTSPPVHSPTRISGPGPSPGPGIQHQQPPQPHQHQQPHQPHQPHQPPLHSPPQHHHQQQQQQTYPQHAPRGPYNSSVLLTPSSNPAPLQTTLPHPGPPRLAHSNSWAPPPINDMGMNNMMHPKPGGFFSARDAAPPLPGPTSMMAYGGVSEEQFARSNFAVWLFDPQTPFSEFSGVATNIPFLEGGLESTFNNNIHYDYESLTGSSQMDPTPPRQMEGPDDLISEARRQEILRMFQLFRKKSDKYESRIVNLVHESGGDLPALNLEMMRDCIQEYWESVSPRLPIIHQPTFSANRCPILLLMVMVALGAASLRSRDGGGSLQDYGAFADVIIEGTRWEIFMAEESIPPVALWVAQALLLLEFYEKLYSSRRFHERAHIYHTATLNFLRRGSPLIGRAGSESPPEDPSPPPPAGAADGGGGAALDSRMWWIRWAESESMHRVVFVAFMLDITHAAMFGHAADMGPHEIRLPLPCDDNLWTAPSPDICRQLDGNLRMYGVKQMSFLDGLKSALHGKEVKTHSFARMIIMSGLLSVGWHLSHRETHLKWLDARAPSAETRDNWRKMLLRAFDVWKVSFDEVNGNGDSDARGATNGPIHSASVLYHLAHICLHVDIIDCQVYAGAKRLLGRKVSSRDYANAVSRMRAWARHSSTRHAVLHAFRLLHRILVDPRKKGPGEGGGGSGARYSIRNDPDPHRPWIMYFASLTVCSFVRALNPPTPPASLRPQLQGVGGHAHHMDVYRRVGVYLASVASLEDLSEKTAAALYDGLPDLLDVLSGILNEAQPELLQEAHARFKTSKDLLMGVTSS